MEQIRGLLGRLNPNDPWLRPLIRKVRERPAMYFGDSKVRTFANWIHGYCNARLDLGLPDFGAGEADLLEGFMCFLAAKKVDRPFSGANWYSLIEQIDNSDSNVHTCFKLFDEYDEFLPSTNLGELRKAYDARFGR